MKISNINSLNPMTFMSSKDNKNVSGSHKKASVVYVPVAIVAMLVSTDGCSKIHPLNEDEFVKQDSLEVLNLEPQDPPFEIVVDTTLNEIHHEITI